MQEYLLLAPRPISDLNECVHRYTSRGEIDGLLDATGNYVKPCPPSPGSGFSSRARNRRWCVLWGRAMVR